MREREGEKEKKSLREEAREENEEKEIMVKMRQKVDSRRE